PFVFQVSRFMDLSPSRSSSVWGSAIKKHPLYLTLENYDFLDELTHEETRTIEAKYAQLNRTPPHQTVRMIGKMKSKMCTLGFRQFTNLWRKYGTLPLSRINIRVVVVVASTSQTHLIRIY